MSSVRWARVSVAINCSSYQNEKISIFCFLVRSFVLLLCLVRHLPNAKILSLTYFYCIARRLSFERVQFWLLFVLLFHLFVSMHMTLHSNFELLPWQFLGTWYEVERSFYLPEVATSCTTLTFESDPNVKISNETTQSPERLEVAVKSVNQWTGGVSVNIGFATPESTNSSIIDIKVNERQFGQKRNVWIWILFLFLAIFHVVYDAFAGCNHTFLANNGKVSSFIHRL